MSKNKTFTWEDLKRIANEIPEDHLTDEVTIWTDDERGTEGTRIIWAD